MRQNSTYNMVRHILARCALVVLFLAFPVFAFAAMSNGGTNYTLGVDALRMMTEDIVLTMIYVMYIVYAIAALTAVYNATVIYIKMNTGEGGFTKSVLMLFGAVLFLIFASIALPAFFGYNFGGSFAGLNTSGLPSIFH